MSAAEIIRQAIESHARSARPERRDLDAWTKERAFIARLIERGSLTGERAWQREDLHER